MGEVEAEEPEDDDTQHEHVLGAPTVVLGLGGHLIALDAATALEVLYAEPDAVADVYQEAKGQDGDHDVNHGRGHEVAAQLEPAVSVGVRHVVGRHLAEVSVHGINDGEEVDGAVQEQEDNQKGAADALNEFLADG